MSGTLANVTSMVLCDPATPPTYGIKRNDSGEIVVAANTALTNSSTGTYTYTFTPVGGVEYTAWIKRIYRGQIAYREVIFMASGDTVSLTGLSFEEAVATTLTNDSHSMVSGHLGALCGYHATTKPNCIFHDYPTERVDTPIVTYSLTGGFGDFPRKVSMDFKVFGGDLQAILDRIRALLHKETGLTATDWRIKGVRRESEGPTLYDENLKCYFRRERYIVTLCKA